MDVQHGISKEEAVKKLNAMGYPAIWEKGIVQIALKHDGKIHTVKELEKVLKNIDYRMSHGYSYAPKEQNISAIDQQRSSHD